MVRVKHILRGLLSLALIVYLVFATKIANSMASHDVCAGMKIIVNDSTPHPFVTATELARELHGLPSRAAGMPLSDIDTDSIRSRLANFDKIESVSVVRYTNDSIIITVSPMHPIARVFDGPKSYYINREGKRISADARYRIDVPVIQGHFSDSVFPTTSIIPLLDYLDNNEKWGSMVSMIKVLSPSDILLIPSVRGQVINFGTADKNTFDDKFRRLDKMYTDVVPLKGWNYYDTISVKWNGQIVASRREKKLVDTGYTEDIDDEEVDVSTMLAGEGVAPGQSIVGRKAKSEKPIPASKVANEKQKEPAEKPADDIKTDKNNQPSKPKKTT